MFGAISVVPTVVLFQLCGTVTRFYMHACELEDWKVGRGVWGCAYYELVLKQAYTQLAIKPQVPN